VLPIRFRKSGVAFRELEPEADWKRRGLLREERAVFTLAHDAIDARAAAGDRQGWREMVLTLVLVGLVGAGLARVAAYFWPQIMTCAREHLLPWIDRNVPDLAESVRLAFHDLDKIGVDLCRAVRAAWRKLRAVLVSQVATFVELFNGDFAIRITSDLRLPQDRDRAPVTVVTEQELDWESLPEEIHAAVMSNGIRGTSIDVVRARDQILTDTV
jgi:hypothetical protein